MFFVKMFLMSIHMPSFVLFVLMGSTEPGCFRSRSLGLFGKLSMSRVHGLWFHGVWTCEVEVFEY
jgi:hypothetical protein